MLKIGICIFLNFFEFCFGRCSALFKFDEHEGVVGGDLFDVADFSAVSRLIDLLDDEDPLVRFHMARGLSRVTGRDMGMESERWKVATAEQRATLIQMWKTWLSARKSHRNAI